MIACGSRWESLASMCVTVLFAAGQALWAQQAVTPAGSPASSELTLHATVRRVIVDVAVTDAQGKPVRGLTSQSFSVAEDGLPQRILSFESHDMDPWRQLAPSHLPVNTFVNLPVQPEMGPLYVLLYDMVNTGPDDQIFARHQLVNFIARKPSGTRFALLAVSDGLHLVQGFTEDRSQLLAALDLQGKRPHMPKIFLYSENVKSGSEYYLAVLEDITQYLDGLPGRKNLIWVSGNYPLAVIPSRIPELVERTKRQLDAMASQQIAIYPVDARGVTLASAAGSYLIEDEIARETGGYAIYSTNDLVEALTKATDDGASYYTLTYLPTNQDYNGKLRLIAIKLRESGYQLSYRREYYADDLGVGSQPPAARSLKSAKAASANPPPDTLDVYMRHGMPTSHDLVFVAHTLAVGSPTMATVEQMADLSNEPAYFRKRRKDRAQKPLPPVPLQSYAIDYSVPSLQFHLLQAGKDEPQQDTLEFAAGGFNAEGWLLNGTIDHATSTRKATTNHYAAEQQFVVPIDAAWLRLAVRDVATGRIGSLEIALPLASEPNPSVQSPRN